MSLQTREEVRNDLLGRREVSCTFNSMAGSLRRQDAVKMVAEKMKVDVKSVYLISLRIITGTRNVSGLFYIYDNPKDAEKQLSKHITLRMLSKEEREKAIKEGKEKEGKKSKEGKKG
ncbi:MAG: hypothetical protein ACUVWK_00215 [Nitrososphaerales archaeon]